MSTARTFQQALEAGVAFHSATRSVGRVSFGPPPEWSDRTTDYAYDRWTWGVPWLMRGWSGPFCHCPYGIQVMWADTPAEAADLLRHWYPCSDRLPVIVERYLGSSLTEGPVYVDSIYPDDCVSVVRAELEVAHVH